VPLPIYQIQLATSTRKLWTKLVTALKQVWNVVIIRPAMPRWRDVSCLSSEVGREGTRGCEESSGEYP
jgi:hypothetical protein